MRTKRSLIDRLIYSITKKPKHYAEVRNPPITVAEKLSRPQDARQLQYNQWSKLHQVYSGSYLPYQARELAKQGWETKRYSQNFYETEHIRKSTGQHVLRHGRHTGRSGAAEPTHYHWLNPAAKALSKKQGNRVYYFDRFGDSCARGSTESHIKPHRKRRQK